MRPEESKEELVQGRAQECPNYAYDWYFVIEISQTIKTFLLFAESTQSSLNSCTIWVALKQLLKC